MNVYLAQTQETLKKVCLEPYNLSQGNKQYDGYKYDFKNKRFVKIIFTISYSQFNEIKYIKNDGQIIRINKLIDLQKSPDILTNLEQINHLQWQGAYNGDLEKVGYWRALWKGAALIDVGGFYKNGKKFGIWKELFKNYWDKAQIYEIGEYSNDNRKGVWKFVYREQQIGGGEYDEQGLKTGNWIDLNDDFWDSHQITYHGQYRNGLKVGQWKTFKEDRNENFELIGGGYYNEQGLKNGQWEDLNSNFNQDENVYFNGAYSNDLKIGMWNINQREEKGDQKIAGGVYNEQGLKEGLWLDVSPEFQKDSKIFYKGNYQNGRKIGRWETIYQNNSIGGGFYDNQELKIGQWAEICDNFWNKCQVVYHGEYKNGKKYGRWDISYKEQILIWPEWIGGGQYDEQGCKIGKWVDLSNNFHDDNQSTYNGEYKNGKKQGIWDLKNIDILIGGGLYDEDGLKNGIWIDQSDIFGADNIVTFQGNYQHGKRINNWTWNYFTEWNNDIQKIDGGFYNAECQKDGIWLDLSDNFENYNQIIYQGEYQNGHKQGKWDIKFRYYLDNDFDLIGGGCYDKDGYRNDQWLDLSENYSKKNQVVYKGKYKKSKKYGEWEIQYKNEQIGGGFYEEFDQKNGVWIELSDQFNQACKILNSGEYIEGKKFGRWQIKYKGWGKNNYKQIGGGWYGEVGLKDGIWIVLSENFREDSKIIYQGVYQNGKKKGKWSIKYRGRREKHYQEIGSGCFDDQGLKNGLWIVLSDTFCDQNQLVYSGKYYNGKKVGKWNEYKIGEKQICKQDQNKE
ncbi:unnamed protein product [Paramecium pentaurelia]|uniref:Uncharacterized protein n=1 Tax=Paramecium pentaurelia TaxID=43138 RepID=A0A8S1XTM6_9CILI|nr:unnamed protein product [Paramecium pentaurelia]